jgi:hypothetical protein
MRDSNNKDPNQKQPGEKRPGKFHYNPGNMSGKSVEICKDMPEGQKDMPEAEADRPRGPGATRP